MEQLPEFIMNHPLLSGGFVIVLVMLIRAEFDYQTGKANQLNPMNAIRMMNNNEDTLVLDVREAADFKKNHIKNARNMPMSTFKNKLGELEKHKDKTVLTYCNSGSQSNRACRMLKKAGFNDVHNISGGINGWLDAKLPTTTK